MSTISSIVDIVHQLVKFKTLPNISELTHTDELIDMLVLSSSHVEKVDPQLGDSLYDLELSLSALLFDDDGMLLDSATKMLAKEGFIIQKVKDQAFSHMLICDQFRILFSN